MRYFPSKTLLLFTLAVGFCWASSCEAQELFLSADPAYRRIVVAKVLSAERIQLENGDRIRLIGIKAPFERPRREKLLVDKYGFEIEPEEPTTDFSQKAYEYVRNLLEGQTVRVEFDRKKNDENFDLYGYVFLLEGNLFVNAEILRMGYADLHISPPNTKHAELLRDAYREARREKRGLRGL